MIPNSLLRSGIYFLILFVLTCTSGEALKKKTRIWSKNTVVKDTTPVKLVARLQFRRWFQWKDLSKQKIDFFLDKTQIGSATTDSTGYARFYYIPKENGSWKLTVSFNGTKSYRAIENSDSVLRVEIRGKARLGSCSNCFQAFRTTKNQCLRCHKELKFESSKTKTIENSKNLSTEIFFPLKRILGLAQLPNDNLVFLTPEEVVSFDGYHFKAKKIPKMMHTPKDSLIQPSVYKHNFYFANSKRLFRFFKKGNQNVFLLENTIIHRLLRGSGIRKLRTEKNRLWIIGTQEVFKQERQQISRIKTLGSTQLNQVLDILTDPKGNIWIAKPNGIHLVDTYKKSHFFPLTGVKNLYWDNKLIVQTQKDIFELKEQKWISICPAVLKGDSIQKICFQKSGPPVYLLSESLYYEPIGKLFLSGVLRQKLPIQAAVVHQEKGLWLATRVGLVMIRISQDRNEYPIPTNVAITYFGLNAKNKPVLGSKNGNYNIFGKKTSSLTSLKKILVRGKQTIQATAEAIWTDKKRIPFKETTEKILQVIQFQEQNYIVTEEAVYLCQPDQYKLFWKAPAKIQCVSSQKKALLFGTTAGLFRYEKGQFIEEEWARGKNIQCVSEYQGQIYAGTEKGLLSHQKKLDTRVAPCLQLLSFNDKLYILSQQKLFLLSKGELNQVPTKSSPISIADGKSFPIILTQQELEIIPDLKQYLKGQFHFLLPLKNGFLGLREQNLVLVQEDKRIERSLPVRLEGALSLHHNRFLLWTKEKEWYSFENGYLKPFDNLNPLLNNPITQVKEQANLVVKTPQGEFVLTKKGWKSHSSSQSSFTDNQGKEWQLIGETLIGPKYRFRTSRYDRVRHLITQKENELWLSGVDIVISLEEGKSKITSYPIKLPSIFDVLRDGNKIYFACGIGLYLFEDGKLKQLSDKKEAFTQIEKDSHSNIWALGQKRLYQIKKATLEPSQEYFTKLNKFGKQLYFLDAYKGIFVFDGSQFKKVVKEIPNCKILCFLPFDTEQGFWVGTNRGLMLFYDEKYQIIPRFQHQSTHLLKRGFNSSIICGGHGSIAKLKLAPANNRTKGKFQVKTLQSIRSYYVQDILALPDETMLFTTNQALLRAQHNRTVPLRLSGTAIRYPKKLFSFNQKIWIQTNSGTLVANLSNNYCDTILNTLNSQALPGSNFKKIICFQDYIFFDYGQSLYSYHPEKGMRLYKESVCCDTNKKFHISEDRLILTSSSGAKLFNNGSFKTWYLSRSYQPILFRKPYLYSIGTDRRSQAQKIQESHINGGTRKMCQIPSDEVFKKILFSGEEKFIITDRSIFHFVPNIPGKLLWQNKKIYGAVQDAAGALFVLSLKGLYRYEAGEFIPVKVPFSNPFFIEKTNDGQIIVAGTKYLHFLGTNIRLGKKNGLKTAIKSIRSFSDGQILLRYTNDEYAILYNKQNIRPLKNIITLPQNSQNSPIVQDKKGMVWYLKGDKIILVKEGKKKLWKRGSKLWKEGTQIHSLITDVTGNVFGLSNQGLINIPEGKPVVGAPTTNILQAVVSAQGTLFFSTSEGIGYLEDKKFRFVADSFALPEPFLQLIPSLEGNIFALTSQGLVALNTNLCEYVVQAKQFGKEQFTQAIALDNGEILVGDSEGLYKLPKTTMKSFPLSKPTTGPLHVIEKGSELLISTGEGLYLLGKNKVLKPLYQSKLNPIGGLWFSNSQGTYELEGEKLKQQYSFETIGRIEKSSSETLFLTSEQIFSLQGTALNSFTLSVLPYGTTFKDIFLTHDKFWVITDKSVALEQENCFKCYTSLPFSTILDIDVGDDRGEKSYWFATNKGVFRFAQDQFLQVGNNSFPKAETIRSLAIFGSYLLLATSNKLYQWKYASFMDPKNKVLLFSKDISQVKKILKRNETYVFCTKNQLYKLVRKQVGKISQITPTGSYQSIAIDPIGNLWIQYPDRLEYLAPESNAPIAKVGHWEDFCNGTIKVQLAGHDYYYQSTSLEYSYRIRPTTQTLPNSWRPFKKTNSLKISSLQWKDYYLEIRAKDASGNIQKTPTLLLVQRARPVFQPE